MYHLQVDVDISFSGPTVNDSTLTDTTYTAAAPLTYNTTFYWRLRTSLADAESTGKTSTYGPWSEARSFTVAVGTAAEGVTDLPTAFDLHPNYPNPFNPSTTIRYDVPEQALVKIAVYDALGRLVEVLSTRHQAPGGHSVTWQSRAAPSGVYFVRMEAGAFAASRRVLLVR